jgi:hypothetical protein
MVHAAGQVHPIGHVEWCGLGAGDEITKGLDRRIRRSRDHHRIAGDQCDEGEILDRMIGQRLGHRGARGERAGQHAHEVSVGLRFCDGVPGGHADCRRVFNEDCLAQALAEPFGEQPTDEIRAAARRRPGYDPERARWPLLGSGRYGQRCGKYGGEEARKHLHSRRHCGESPAGPT